MYLLLHELALFQVMSYHCLPMQVFVANPNKPQTIIDILINNKEKLLKYLEEFHTDKGRASALCI